MLQCCHHRCRCLLFLQHTRINVAQTAVAAQRPFVVLGSNSNRASQSSLTLGGKRIYSPSFSGKILRPPVFVINTGCVLTKQTKNHYHHANWCRVCSFGAGQLSQHLGGENRISQALLRPPMTANIQLKNRSSWEQAAPLRDKG
jgi:hypothetical protein